MQKDQWINEVLESTKGLQKASPGPFLFEKIAAHIENGKKLSLSKPFSVQIKWALSTAMVVLIVLNVLAIKSYLGQIQVPQNSSQNVSINSEYNNSTIYNY